ncbi:zinc-dependent metalloprotease [Flavobacterium psychrotrophum]|uniref:zinc-dependent metalloprotease n=1 Tax=Flavobacterium psychrotrophum TaxID=2294119 RepID=UPI000E31D59B|nr:zinc-dependent metalloprotease family protein [Flavobacterium psychrotrophum]
MKKLLLATILLFAFFFGNAQNGGWEKTNEATLKGREKMDRIAMPGTYNLFDLDYATFKKVLSTAPLRSAGGNSNLIVAFPNAEGKTEHYRIYEASVMHPELAAKYPELRSYSGQGIETPSATVRFSTTIFGLHAMVLSPKGVLYIDPYTKDAATYISYRKVDLKEDRSFSCEVAENPVKEKAQNFGEGLRAPANNDGVFRTYRLAMASTFEYSNFHIRAAGVANGTDAQKKAAVLAAMVVSMTRINGVYEREVAVTMELVPNNTNVIFLTSNDGLTNNNAGALIGESQTVIDRIIGYNNYDIGHTVSTGGGGLAQLGSICSRSKAMGITGSPAPVGDPYDIDYVAHEMGHQFGGNHIFNGEDGSCDGNANNRTSVEPGSGTTIMGYAGICGGANVQEHSDAYFNAVSLAEIFEVLTSTGCAATNTIANAAPVVPALTNRTIPRSTAFVLKGSNATDANGDALTYTWEQIDGVTNDNLHANTPTSFAIQGPNYRSVVPSTSKNRYFPQLSDVLEGNLYPTWEMTSDVARTLRFAYTVRDNSVLGGQTSRRDVAITVNATAGPFAVTSQDDDNIVWEGGDQQTVTWDVAGTTANGINTATVNILLSTNGGQTFDTVLVANTPNDGSETFTVPANIQAPFCRLMVEAVNNVYYAVNPIDFSVGLIVSTECATYEGTGNVSIPDNTTAFTTSNASVTRVNRVTSVTVNVSADHTNVGDLIFKVKSPASTEVLLWDRQCGTRDNLNVTYSDNGNSFVCGNPTRGTYVPVESLSAFAGQDARGTWQLEFSDIQAQNTGTLNSWSIQVCGYVFTPAAVAEFGLKDFKLYPNPNKGSFNVEFVSVSQKPVMLGVYDMSGRQVYNRSYANTGLFSNNISLGTVQQGVYLVVVQDGNRKETRKIVIE